MKLALIQINVPDRSVVYAVESESGRLVVGPATAYYAEGSVTFSAIKRDIRPTALALMAATMSRLSSDVSTLSTSALDL